jgi:hypothetical protein
VRHRTLSGAPATSPGRWVSTVGASDNWTTGQSCGASDRSCSLSGAPSAPGLTSTCAVVHCSISLFLCRRSLARYSRYSAGTPDSPVNYSGVAPRIPEGGKFGVGFPGAPDTVRWCTRHCPVAHRIVRCARPGLPLGCLLLFLFEPFLGLLLVCVEPLAPVELII